MFAKITKQFYLRCLTQAYKMQSMTELNSFLSSVLVVTLSENIDYVDDTSETCLQLANNCIKGVHVEDINITNFNTTEPCDDFSNSEHTSLS